jgi:acyl-CoA dehydrogenase
MGVCSDAIQVVGATGADEDFLLEKWFRDIKVFDIFEGTGQAQRIVISKRILQHLRSF